MRSMASIEPHGYLKKVLSPGETILYVVRQHGIFFFGHIFLWLLLAIAIAVGTVMLTAGGVPPLGLILLVIPLGIIWWQYLEWTNHGYYLTNRRVIQLTGV